MDKLLHFLTGFLIATVFQFSVLAMVLSVVIAGVGKEIFDQIKYGGFDYKDLICTLTGGFAGYWVTLVY